jgi:hypothetical protein
MNAETVYRICRTSKIKRSQVAAASPEARISKGTSERALSPRVASRRSSSHLTRLRVELLATELPKLTLMPEVPEKVRFLAMN